LSAAATFGVRESNLVGAAAPEGSEAEESALVGSGLGAASTELEADGLQASNKYPQSANDGVRIWSDQCIATNTSLLGAGSRVDEGGLVPAGLNVPGIHSMMDWDPTEILAKVAQLHDFQG
jgi:hypothetical protein